MLALLRAPRGRWRAVAIMLAVVLGTGVATVVPRAFAAETQAAVSADVDVIGDVLAPSGPPNEFFARFLVVNRGPNNIVSDPRRVRRDW